MLKRIFALASVTALSGLVAAVAAAGCSSTVISAQAEGGVEGGVDARVVREAAPEEEAGPPKCPTTAPIDATSSPWKPPGVIPGSCTEDEIKALVKAVDDNNQITYPALKAIITNAACKSCLFAPDGAKWAPFIENAKGEFDRQNFGGCIAAVTGNEACGKAYSQYDDCVSTACGDCADQASFDKCASPAAKGACKVATANVNTVCGAAISGISTCQNLSDKYLFESAARALCVGTGDGGVDGGADANDGG